MELTAGNLSRRSRALGAASKSAKVRNLRRCDWAQLRNFRSQKSSSVEMCVYFFISGVFARADRREVRRTNKGEGGRKSEKDTER
jgi:hypothetical protein